MENKGVTLLSQRTAIACVACVLVAGCAHSSGVLKLGPDTYTVSAAASAARGGWASAQKTALTTANDHCAQMGKEILVTNVDAARTNVYGGGSSAVTFRCLDKGDPELQRPEYRR